MELQFTYLEINPLVVTTQAVHILDLASRLDQTAEYLCASKWGPIGFPPPFGRDAYPEVKRQSNHNS
jgi:ATP citrate (pro-S)-lyase